MKCRTNKVELRLILSGIFSILHMEMINDKCGAAHHLLNQRARAGLRANGRFLRFARRCNLKVDRERNTEIKAISDK